MYVFIYLFMLMCVRVLMYVVGTSVVSENRKANQAIYNSFDLRSDQTSKDPLWELYNRVINVTNRHAGLSIDPPGQEPFTIIQYNKDDQYT
jgi:hypothetical protein